MLGAGWLNLGSLVLGLVAWLLPVVNLVRSGKAGQRNFAVLSIVSVSTCAVSLCLQIFYTDYLVKIGDWAALMDTSSAVALVSATLLVITLVLNAVALIVYYKKKSKDRQEWPA